MSSPNRQIANAKATTAVGVRNAETTSAAGREIATDLVMAG